jgi:hypothetical protein
MTIMLSAIIVKTLSRGKKELEGITATVVRLIFAQTVAVKDWFLDLLLRDKCLLTLSKMVEVLVTTNKE